MTPDDAELVHSEDDRPEFTTERLALDAATATEHLLDAVGSVTATETDSGTKVRTHGGMLIAVLTPAGDERCDLQYRTEPAADSATLKAQRLWRAMQQYAE